MLQSLKRLTKHSALYGVGHILTRSIGFLLLPIHTNVLSTDQMGVAALLFSSLGILNIAFGYGMDTAFLRHFITEDSKEERQKIFSTAFITLLTSGVLLATLLLTQASFFSSLIFDSPEHVLLIQLAAGILLADVLVLLPFLILRALQRPVRFGLLKLVNVLANVGFNLYFLVVLKKGVPGIFMANLTASAISLVTVLPVIFQWFRLKYSKSILVELLKFGLPYIPSMLSVMVMDQISRFFLARMIDNDAAGIFSAAYKLGMFMALVVAAFRFAWTPFFLNTVKQDDAKAIFSKVLTYFMLITSSLLVTTCLFMDEIIHFSIMGYTILGAKYEVGLPIVPVVMLAYLTYGVYVNFIVGVYVEKKTPALAFITGAGALVNVLTNFLLIPVAGIMGAAVATLLAYVTMAGILYFYSRKLYKVEYEWGRILKLVLTMATAFFCGMLVKHQPFSFVFRLGVLFSSFAILWITGFFTPREKSLILRKLRLDKAL